MSKKSTFILTFLIVAFIKPTYGFTEDLNTKKSVVLNDEAVLYVFSGNKEKALEKLHKALDCNPENTTVLYNLSGLYLANNATENSTENAKSLIEKALAIKPKDISFLTRYGEVLMSANEFALAENIFFKILTLEPRHVSARQKLAIVYGMQQKWELAENTFQSLRKVKGDDKNLLSNIGNIMLVREKYREAIRMLERAQVIHADANNSVSLGIAYEALGQKQKALLSYKRAKALGKKDKSIIAHINELNDRSDNMTFVKMEEPLPQ